MDRFDKVREYGGSVNKNVWLVLGAVLIVGLIAATFVYGRNDDSANQTAAVEETGGEAAADGAVDNAEDAEKSENETAAPNADDGATAGASTEDNGNGTTGAGESGNPDALADTGAASAPLAVAVIGAGGYLWQRSRRQLTRSHTLT